MDKPVRLELNQLFGAIGLRYTVAVESYGIVRVKKNSKRAQLYLSAGELSEVGARTRLAIRADDGTGCSVSATFNIELVQQVTSPVYAA